MEQLKEKARHKLQKTKNIKQRFQQREKLPAIIETTLESDDDDEDDINQTQNIPEKPIEYKQEETEEEEEEETWWQRCLRGRTMPEENLANRNGIRSRLKTDFHGQNVVVSQIENADNFWNADNWKLRKKWSYLLTEPSDKQT